MQLKEALVGTDNELSFSTLFEEMSNRCVNMSAAQLDGVLDECQRLICQRLGVDQSELWQAYEGAEDSLLLTHLYRRTDGSPTPIQLTRGLTNRDRAMEHEDPPLRTDVNAFFPWMLAQARRGATVVISDLDQLPEEACRDREMFAQEGIRALVIVPLSTGGQWLGFLAFGMTEAKRKWTDPEVRELRLVGDIFASALARIRTQEELRRSSLQIEVLKERLKAETEYLREEIQLNHRHTDVVGRSRAIRKVLQQVEQVAPVSCPVLITGESGTGKELIAQSIHRLSARCNRMMVTVNCATLPASLVESELFGRERGAYTGALSSQAGRFEIADESTIFLDEIAELPLELQGKLLRVLQEGEYARLGNPKTRKVNVRVIAATNRDLTEEVRKKSFREDLFYRLSVFPINLPPLRERVEDIPLLVFSFLEELASRMGKRIARVPRKVMESLERHYWPGNIRELRNVIERGVILSSGDTLRIALAANPHAAAQQAVTLAEVERRHILATLEKTSWQIKGPHGAAKILDLKPGTLYSRMRKLGVPHRRQKDGMLT